MARAAQHLMHEGVYVSLEFLVLFDNVILQIMHFNVNFTPKSNTHGYEMSEHVEALKLIFITISKRMLDVI